MAADVWIGRELAGYRIERILGRGGMGVVYLAEDTRLGRKVALKLLAPDLAEDARFRERFVRESRLAASIDHPHIIPIYAAGESEDTLYLAMRYIEGTDLRALVGEHGALEPARAAAIVRQLAGALDAAQARGLVHRDVKPANVLLPAGPGDEHAYLTDFGLTKQASSITGLTATGQLVGTVDYLAPEVIEGKPADGRSDQYALACLLVECLTGTPPFRRETEAATLWAHMNADRAQLPVAGDDVRAAIERGLALSPDDRFPTCADLARAAAGSPPVAAPASRRGWLLAAAIASLALVAAVVAAVTASGGGRSHAAAPPAVPPGSVAVIDPRTGRLASTIHVGGVPGDIAVAGGSVYVSDPTRKYLTRIDAARARIAGRTSTLGATPTGIAPAPDGSLWVADGFAQAVLRVDPTGHTHLAWSARAGACCPGPSVIAAGFRAVWVADAGGLRMLDPKTGHTVRARPPAGAAGIAEDVYGNAWVVDGLHSLRYFSALTAAGGGGFSGVVTAAGLGQASAVAYGDGTNWVTATQAGAVYPVGAAIGPVEVGPKPTSVAFGAGYVWVADGAAGVVVQLEPITGRIVRRIRVGSRIGGIAAGDGRVWVTVRPAAAGAAAAAYQLAFSDHHEVYVARGDGSGRRVVANGSTRPTGAVSWSADGSRIAFETGDSSHPSHLAAVNAAGGPVTQLVGLDGAGDPAWSPDERLIAFRHNNGIWLVGSDGRGPRPLVRLTDPTASAYSPSWAPDGSGLVFSATDPGWRQGARIYRVARDGSGIRRVGLPGGYADGGRWSPDGYRLVFNDSIGGNGTYVASVGGGQTYKVVDVPGYGAGLAAWSPDGLLVTSGARAGPMPGGRTNLYVMYADGSGRTRITTDFAVDGVAWRPVREPLASG